MTDSRIFRSSLICILILTAPTAGLAAGSSATNIEVTIDLIDSGGNERSYRIVASNGGRETSLSTGMRVPIPATTFNTSQASGGSIVPVTSYTYQNVGFSANVQTKIGDPGEINVVLDLESSAVLAEEARSALGYELPVIETVQQRFQVVLRDGKPVEVGRIARPGQSPLVVRLTAAVLD